MRQSSKFHTASEERKPTAQMERMYFLRILNSRAQYKVVNTSHVLISKVHHGARSEDSLNLMEKKKKKVANIKLTREIGALLTSNTSGPPTCRVAVTDPRKRVRTYMFARAAGGTIRPVQRRLTGGSRCCTTGYNEVDSSGDLRLRVEIDRTGRKGDRRRADGGGDEDSRTTAVHRYISRDTTLSVPHRLTCP